jgi:hypothetical protein
MARQRKSTVTTSKPNEGRVTMANVLDPARIQELLAAGRTRGAYGSVLKSFLDSGEAGIEVPLDSGEIAGKSSKQAKTGLDNARKRTDDNGKLVYEGSQNVRVIEQEGHVFLINTSVTSDEE